jgi:hypothetical protein
MQPELIGAQGRPQAANPRRQREEQGQVEQLQKEGDFRRREAVVGDDLDDQIAERKQAEADQREKNAPLVLLVQKSSPSGPR